MNAIILERPGRLRLGSSPAPGRLAPDDALVRVHRVGVCGTDIHAFGGTQPFFSYPRILGHELGVEVVAVGEAVQNIGPGEHCSVEPYLDCGRCIACRRGKPNCCTELKVLGVHTDGGMREQIIVPTRKLHKSQKLSFDQLALVETLAIGAHAVERAAVQAGEFVLIIGVGPIGLAVAEFAAQAGARLIVLDMNRQRLQFCARRFPGIHTIEAANHNVLERLKEITRNDLPTAVFDATGSVASMQTAFGLTAHGGRLIFVGLFQGDVSFNDPEFHRRELTLLSSRNARAEDFARIIRLIEDGRIDTSAWISHRAPFGEVLSQFPRWTQPETGVIKALIEL